MNEQCNSELAFTQTYVLLPRYGTFFTPVSKVGLSWMNTIMYATTHDQSDVHVLLLDEQDITVLKLIILNANTHQ